MTSFITITYSDNSDMLSTHCMSDCGNCGIPGVRDVTTPAIQPGLGPHWLSSWWADEENARWAEICIRYRGAISRSSVAWTAASIVLGNGHSEACWQLGKISAFRKPGFLKKAQPSSLSVFYYIFGSYVILGGRAFEQYWRCQINMEIENDAEVYPKKWNLL